MSAGLPRISLLVAVRNEARHLASTLEALVAQDCPPDWLEVLVIDGESTDDTVTIARGFSNRLPGLRVISNPRILSAAAWNIGLAEARAPVISILSGHVALPRDYIRVMLSQLTNDLAGVGGRAVPVGVDARSQLIAQVFTSRLGNGGASFMQDGAPRAVESIAFGTYWREVLQAIGGFDERIVRGQDWDLNLRLRMAGHTLWYMPDLEIRYSTRSNLSALWQRQYLAGLWKPYIHKKNGRPFLWRHWVPSAFIVCLAATAVAGVLWPKILTASASILLLHLVATFWQMKKLEISWQDAPTFLCAMWIVHAGYGIGFCFGLFRRVETQLDTDQTE